MLPKYAAEGMIKIWTIAPEMEGVTEFVNDITESKKDEPKSLKELFQNFDYKKYWSDYEKENPGKSKEMDWGKPVGREVF